MNEQKAKELQETVKSFTPDAPTLKAFLAGLGTGAILGPEIVSVVLDRIGIGPLPKETK